MIKFGDYRAQRPYSSSNKSVGTNFHWNSSEPIIYGYLAKSGASSITPFMIKSVYKDIEIPKISIFDFILPEEQHFNHKTAFIDSTSDLHLTISQLRRDALKLANGMRKHQKIGRDDRVLILSPNTLVYPILFLGSSATGAVVSLANPAYNYFELSHQIKDSEVSFIFAHPDNIDLTIKILKEMEWSDIKISERVVLATGQPSNHYKSYTQLFCDQIQHGIPEKFDGESAHDVAVICYSSGTTGASKGVMTTHHNIVSNVHQLHNTHAWALQKSDIVLSFLVSITLALLAYLRNILQPFYHICK